MAKQVTQLNQTAERIVQLLDTVDAAVSSANDTLFWTTKTTNGKTSLTQFALLFVLLLVQSALHHVCSPILFQGVHI